MDMAIRDERDQPRDWFRTSIGPSVRILHLDGPDGLLRVIDSERSASRVVSPWARSAISGWSAATPPWNPIAAGWRGLLDPVLLRAALASRCRPVAPGLGSCLPLPSRPAVTA